MYLVDNLKKKINSLFVSIIQMMYVLYVKLNFEKKTNKNTHVNHKEISFSFLF